MDPVEGDHRDIELDVLTQNDLDRKAWKYIGYKGFSQFVSSDDDFIALRRFDRLHSRVLLTLQDHVAQLEENLDSLDNSLSGKRAEDIDNGTVRHDQSESRRELLKRIVIALKEYAKSPKSLLRRFFEQCVLVPTMGLFGLFRDKHEKQNHSLGPSTVFGKDEPVDLLASIALFVVALVMLIAPLWILAMVEEMVSRLLVITAFVFVLLGVLSWATLARPFEVLAATAG
ncbi:hypothetical protein DL762_006286 [Monosporascus cannonballus]|uniref:DUF6594 domain-containing protein n=1 Tax=Monosporascus cannonballus TaxID=155416 RepID=A0ABY0H720_9PEZI|nr:hypothetical protein DL762_006286 [Monosporascus cannonballus]